MDAKREQPNPGLNRTTPLTRRRTVRPTTLGRIRYMAKLRPEEEFSRQWELQVSVALKELLEKKHLYQSVRLTDPGEIALRLATAFSPEDRSRFAQAQKAWAEGFWSINGPNDPSYLGQAIGAGVPRPNPAPPLPNLKIFCGRCDRLEPYNPLSAKDSVPRNCLDAEAYLPRVQVLVASYLCQSCKSFPEFFMIRREGLKLTLSGRTPIEHVDVPEVIPRQVARFFSDAVVAHQSGQHLPGNFMLRTLIEQWALQSSCCSGPADQALDAYMASLPDDFKARFPSLRSLYGALSVDIHGAIGSIELFERACTELVEHFSARSIFKLDALNKPNTAAQPDSYAAG